MKHWLLILLLGCAWPVWAAQPDPVMLETVAGLRARAGLEGAQARTAQVWLDFAQEEFIELDDTGVAEDALARARQLVEWIERRQVSGVAAPDPLRGTQRVREDLWQRLGKVRPKVCAQPWVGPIEVYLLWAGHEQPELGDRHARRQEDEAERELEQAESCSDEPVPLVAPPPKAAVSVAPPWANMPNVVHFATAQAHLSAESQAVLQQVAQMMQTYPQLRVLLGGHADPRGNVAYNLRLSQRRVEQVRRYLLTQGVAAGRLEVRAFGRQQSAGQDNSTRARERRVELQLVNPDAVQHLRSETQERDLQK